MSCGAAQAIELVEPIACPDDATCYIQSLVDRDAGAGAQDFACGPRSYDGHQGVDFRVATMREMERGVPILAAASGVVRAVRDGEPDRGSKSAAKGKDCGNGVVIDHADGWSTQYCHLAFGGVEVSQNQRVAAGERIGRMGYSGRTDFPHLHFTVRRFGVVVDPFDGEVARASCDAAGGAGQGGLWTELTLDLDGGLVDQGFTSTPPTLEAIRAGMDDERLKRSADALIIWARAYSLRKGDILSIELIAPGGVILAESDHTLDRNRFEEMRFIGKKRPADGWAAGTYAAEIMLIRDGATLDERRVTTTID